MSTNARCPNCQVAINQTMKYCSECGSLTKDNSNSPRHRALQIIKFILIFPVGLFAGSIANLFISEFRMPMALRGVVAFSVAIAVIAILIIRLENKRKPSRETSNAFKQKAASPDGNDIPEYKLGISLLTYQSDIGHVISNTIKGSANSSGLKGGDVLLQIDGEDVKALSLKEVTEKLGNRAKNQPVNILISRRHGFLDRRKTNSFTVNADVEDS